MGQWWDDELRYLKGVGPRMAEKLASLGLHKQQDLLFHLPLRYEDRTRITPVGALQPGSRAQIEAEVLQSAVRFRRRGRSGRSLEARLSDNTGMVSLRLFYFNASQQQMFEKGNWLRCYGEVRWSSNGVEMIHPEISVINPQQPTALPTTLTPIYPVTEGLHQKTMRRIVEQVIEKLESQGMQETLPLQWLQRQGFPDFTEAMIGLHNPTDISDCQLIQENRHPAQNRFVVEELAAHRLVLLERRRWLRSTPSPVIDQQTRLQAELVSQLPFPLTAAQSRVLDEINSDFGASKPMMRLLQGDVGSGKTVVAALACLPVIESGFQAVLMAPTEILAEQHSRNLLEWLQPLGIQVTQLTGSDKGKRRQQKLLSLGNGDSQLIVGTHALFQDDVAFCRLGLMIVDEQHRFGVDQRLALRRKTIDGLMPHQLIMTATPIPRTMAMSLYADLDYSQIDELPPGRKPVTTSIVSQDQRDQLIQRVSESCKNGAQVYWVCTLIEESESLQCEAAELTYERLLKQLPGFNIGLVHGRMKSEVKEAVLQSFKAGELSLLVATTVIEVGVDVPNATIMVIENPERLGLAQIHQLRGRVGRGAKESFCILMVPSSLSSQAMERMEIIRKNQDGFVIAEKDLELRGAGELVGTRQTGEASFRVADLLRDQKWFTSANELASLLQQPGHESTRDALISHWIGSRQDYTDVG